MSTEARETTGSGGREAGERAGAGGGWGRRIGWGLGAVAVVALLWLGGRQLGGYVPEFRERIAGLGAWAPVAFILGYAVAAVAFVPGAPLTIAAGVLFGLVEGTLYTLIGATLGASAAFLIARYGARSWVEKKLSGSPRLAAVDRAVAREGGKIVALLRLSPVFPFNLLNYALGLTKVRFVAYLAACLAMLPGTLLYVYYGKVFGDVAAAAGGEGGKSPWEWALLGVGLAATVVVTVLITRRAKKALAEASVETGEGEGEAKSDG
jgi:uncharacterized membrane protein YdjX (TVP38/TMEM64 family)